MLLAAARPAAVAAGAGLAGPRIRQYELIRELGHGGMGVVHLARDLRLDRLVAIKLLTKPGQPRGRFMAEARATARCQHENIVVIHDVGMHGDQPYLVFEYLRGQTLHQCMEAWLGRVCRARDGSRSSSEISAPLTPAQAAEIMVPVVRALVCAHEMGIIHCDLKPANIMLTEEGVTKVLDFGVAKIRAARVDRLIQGADASRDPAVVTVLGAVQGTLPYMSPEQLAGKVVDHRSDIWAVGIMLHELVTGVHPLAPLSRVKIHRMADLSTPMPGVREHRHDLGPLADIIDQCLRKHREHRTASALALLRALESLLPGPQKEPDQPGRQASQTGPQPGRTNTRKNPHWTEDYARQVLARAEREGKSMAALAREQSVSPQRLYWWKRRLRDEDARSSSSFVEMSIPPPRHGQPFAVQTRNGRSVAVWPGFDAAELARLLAVVEGNPC